MRREGRPLVEVGEAVRRLLDAATPLDPVEVDLTTARGRVLAEDVLADRDSPATDRSAMDGFAVRAVDAPELGAVLRVVGAVRAGSAPPNRILAAGEALRIYTGAVVPPGADAVVMVELTEEDRAASTVRLRERPLAGQNVRRRGEEIRRGDVLVETGAVVDPARIAALASAGRTRVTVHRAPTVAVLATGDEIVETGRIPEPHQVRNSNATAILAALAAMGLEGTDLGIASDDTTSLDAAMARGLDHDVLLVTGGVSVGDYDLVATALSRRGIDILFHGVAMRPGKPALAGRRGGRLVLGLPGNPVSAFSVFAVLAAPALRRMLGHDRCEDPEIVATLASALKARPGVTTFHLARVAVEGGRVIAHPVASAGSADVASLARANAFVVTSGAARGLEGGTEVVARVWGWSEPV